MRLSWRKRKNGEYQTQPSYDWKKFGHKIFKANQIARFFFTKFQHHDQHQNQYHDWNLLYKFWLQITFGVLSKVSLKVKVNLFKISNIILPSICRHGNVNFKATYVHFFTSDNNLHTIQVSDARWKNLKIGFYLYFYVF